MPPITLEQALYQRPDHGEPRLLARSPGFADAWLPDAEHLILGFGARRNALRCPLSIFGKPLNKKQIALVRVKDENPSFPTGLRFHILVVSRKDYEACVRDPFILASKVEPTWHGNLLPSLTIAEEMFQPRTIAQVQAVLKRVKAAALQESDDPESPHFERTVENSESPALLGGAQILVDSGRVVFERPEGDLALASGMWLLLPEQTRCRLWPCSFAFSRELEFDLLIVPQLDDTMLDGYTTEDQAADYPHGTYEFALQHAAEQGGQAELDAVFAKRDSRQTMRLAVTILIVLSAAVLISRWLELGPRPSVTVQHQKQAAAAGIVAVGDPWADAAMLTYWQMLAKPREKPHDAK